MEFKFEYGKKAREKPAGLRHGLGMTRTRAFSNMVELAPQPPKHRNSHARLFHVSTRSLAFRTNFVRGSESILTENDAQLAPR